jgi:F420-dependent oxidoreductase-like protein
MRIGSLIGEQGGIDGIIRQIQEAKDAGFASAWMAQVFGVDALTVLAVAGREVPDIELGTAVVPTYPRHPMMLASQALTTNAATGGRLALGIGLSHQVVIESMFGYSFDKPARHMREYLSVLMPLLRGENVSFEGETLKATGQPIRIEGATAPQVLLAALAPRMLELAGSLTDGTVTWMAGPATVESHIVPRINEAAKKAGRPAPRVSVGLPVCITNDVDAARQTAAKTFAIYGQLPSYRAMLDKEGAPGPADVAIVGDEDSVAGQVRAVFDAGATDFNVAAFGAKNERTRTMALMAELARS